MAGWLHTLQAPTPILPLVVFRVAFGLVMAASTARFLAKGWVETLWVAPPFHFTYYGFGWVRPLPGPAMVAAVVALGVLALFVALGFRYRPSVAAFLALFTYVELIDKATYLNHYYFVSLASFLLFWLPAHRACSLDAWQGRVERAAWVPGWTVAALRLQVGLVYFFAGLAKLKGDWLVQALPLRIWLPTNSHFPLVGPLFDQPWAAYAMSWAGAAFDLTVPFALLHRRTRPVAYAAVVAFHAMTGLLFPTIGIFPWLMALAALVFWEAEDFQRLSRLWHRWTGRRAPLVEPPSGAERVAALMPQPGRRWRGTAISTLLLCFFAAQLVVPLRHWLYPGNVMWTEEGFRFAWNVMLAEKTGYVTFTLRDPASGQQWVVYPSDFLTAQQEKQMAFQPDMIWEFACWLDARWRAQGHPDPEVRAEAWVSLNGRPSRLLVDPTVDLSAQRNSLAAKPWILPGP